MSNETDRATPRPWFCNTASNRHGMADIFEQAANPADQATLLARDLDPANAALIVRAVNAHDALREALAATRQQLVDVYAAIHDMGLAGRFVDDGTNMMSEAETAIGRADAALALARGEVQP